MEKHIKIFGKEILTWGDKAPIDVLNVPRVNSSGNEAMPTPVRLPSGRSSISPATQKYIPYGADSEILMPEYYLDLIPYIRQLAHTNPNMSQALSNIVELGNTGHTIQFDAEVPEQQIVKMRQHLEEVRKKWAPAKASINGITDRMFRQIMIGGALSVEWVPKSDLSGIQMQAMVNPETVRWGYDNKKNQWQPYQAITGSILPTNFNNTVDKNLITLNPNTFNYFSLNGDTDLPYGIPPYLASLDPLSTQKVMMDNLKFLMEQIGLAGFMEMKMEKPDNKGDMNDDQYNAYLDKFLDEAKERVMKGFRDGISVAYKEDVEFKFNSTSKSMGGVEEFFIINELLFASGLNMDPSMMGKNYGTSESQITVVFTKLLSQLNTIQQMVATSLEFGYTLELRLAGFKFKALNVEFNPSTALDELKYQQAEEIRIRNSNQLYADGIISQQQYAQRHNYETANQLEPRYIPTSRETPQDAAARRKAENEKKNEGDKKSIRKKTNKDIKDK